MRAKDVDRYNALVEKRLGVAPLPIEGDHLVERARAGEHEVVLVDGTVFLLLEGEEGDERVMPTLRSLMANKPERAWVTVDMGAIPFLRNGADVMSPGITEADPAIAEGDLVWVRDEKHGMPLAIGRALVTGTEMAEASKGKAITTLHFVGDELWSIGAE